MNPDYEKHLEAEIDQALKGLPDLEAPETLTRRVMMTLARRTARAWYRQPWEFWPSPLRTLAVAILVSSFGGLCFASWMLMRASGVQLAVQEVAQAFSGVFALCNAFAAVLNGLVVALKQVHPAILFGCASAFALAWALCLGLGTVCVKLAWAKR
jgi:hypothetical protein